MKRVTCVLISLLLIVPIILAAQDNLPESREATLIETTSPTEVMVRATGYGHHDPKGLFKKPDPKVMNERAETDAMKAAIYFLLYSSDTPILQTPQEKQAFQGIQPDFFKTDHLRKFITWENPSYLNRIKVNNTTVKIETSFKINKQAITDELVNQGIVTAREDITQKLGLPYIMVLPHAEGGESPLDLLANNPQLKKSAEVIESYLTSRHYDVLVPEQVQAINSMQQTAQFMSGMQDDFSYQLALSVGSDIYITYTVNISRRKIGNTQVAKASAGVRAYETTTARLLGSETGYSQERPGDEMQLIEEAMNNAIDPALSKINSYWKDDLTQGVQYKLVISLGSGFDGDTAEDIAWGIGDILQKITKDYKENVISEKTLDYLIWCDPEKYGRSSNVYRTLKEEYQNDALPGELDREAINRKLLLLTVKE